MPAPAANRCQLQFLPPRHPYGHPCGPGVVHQSRDRKEAGVAQPSRDREGAAPRQGAPPRQGAEITCPCKRWTRHGSTRYLWNDEQLHRAIHYVVYEQGPPMAIFYQARYETNDRSRHGKGAEPRLNPRNLPANGGASAHYNAR